MIIDLKETLLQAAEAADGRKRDHRWKKWAKEIAAIDKTERNGYAFLGEWVDSGTIEIEPKTRLYMVGIERGSNKYRDYTYNFFTMDADGNLTHRLAANDDKRGWALEIRDEVEAILAEIAGVEINPLADFSTDDLRAELERRGAL